MTKISRGSTFLLCAILGIALLIGAVCSFTLNFNGSISAAEVQGTSVTVSRSARNDSTAMISCTFYIYYNESSIISNATIAGVSTYQAGASYPDSAGFSWYSRRIVISLALGYVWLSDCQITGKFAWCPEDQYTTAVAAREAAYSAAKSKNVTFTYSSENNFSGDSSITTSKGGDNYNSNTTTYIAAVIILNSITSGYQQIGYDITSSITNGGADKATVDKSSDIYNIAQNTQNTFTYTSLNSNYITGLTINNANVTISASSTAPGNFTQTTGCQYKAYRNAGNQVTVIVTNLTQNTTIIAINSTISPSVSGGSGTTATVAATSASGGPQYTYTFTSYENYYINRITINGTQITISDTTNTNFNTAGNTSYYCYRNQNQVILVVKDIIQNTNIIGYYDTLFTVTSANPTLVLQDTTTYTRANYFDTAVDIVATFEQNENIQFTIDGVTIRLQGKNSTGEVILPSGKFNYSHNVHDNYVVIRLTNLPNPRHDVTLDHYVGDMEIVNITSSGGSGGLSRTYIEDSGLIRVVFSPTADNEWVYSLRFDNVEVMLTYYKAELYGVGGFSTIRYIAKDSTNTVTLEIEGIYESTNIVFNLTTSKPNYQVPPTNSGGGSFGVAGTVVAAGIGGEARIVGNDIANGTADDTVTFVALAYTGYRFVGWVDASNETEVISTSSTAVLSRDEVNGKVIKALFEEIPTNSSSNGSLNGSHDFV